MARHLPVALTGFEFGKGLSGDHHREVSAWGWVVFCLQAGVSTFHKGFKGLPKSQVGCLLGFHPCLAHLWLHLSTSGTFWWLTGLLLLSKQRRQVTAQAGRIAIRPDKELPGSEGG